MDLPKRKTIRVQRFNYSSPGIYFFTVCTHEHRHLFGRVRNNRVEHNALGRIALGEWLRTPELRAGVELGAFVLMPNHLHAIVFLHAIPGKKETGGQQPAPTALAGPRSHSLGSIIRGYKAATTSQINALRGTPDKPVWQRNYFERIVRKQGELLRIEQYIADNPALWDKDPGGAIDLPWLPID